MALRALTGGLRASNSPAPVQVDPQRFLGRQISEPSLREASPPSTTSRRPTNTPQTPQNATREPSRPKPSNYTPRHPQSVRSPHRKSQS
nr:MAG TPA: hypothetical protein [Caudoviricetes sp.]